MFSCLLLILFLLVFVALFGLVSFCQYCGKLANQGGKCVKRIHDGAMPDVYSGRNNHSHPSLGENQRPGAGRNGTAGKTKKAQSPSANLGTSSEFVAHPPALLR